MKNSRLLLVVFLAFLFSPMFLIPTNVYQATEAISTTDTAIQSSSPFSLSTPPVPQVPRDIRVAIYDEPNTTIPNYISGFAGVPRNNVSGLATILSANPQISVTILDVHDIYNHELTTANYDVLAMVDNLPRENITNQIQEFWLGGGGILSFDGSSIYLCALGILPPEAIGTTGGGVYWNFLSNQILIDVRHPISKAYAVNDLFPQTITGYLMWDWTALQGSVIGGDLIRVASDSVTPNSCNVLAFDPTDRGGRIVTLAWDLVGETMPALDEMIRDSVDWLCPRPKARILFDLRHDPYYGVDSWDPITFNRYSDWRNELVMRTYTFDKLYPYASGAITGADLAPYDILIMVWPQINFTAAEVTAIENWVLSGGSLLAMGDNPGAGWTSNINYLLTNLGLSVNMTAGSISGTFSYFDEHPTTEGCTSIDYTTCAWINYSGSAYPIWGEDADNTLIAANELGAGRVILTGDCQPWQDAELPNASNRRYAINMVNWLTASTADVLLMIDYEPWHPDPYTTPVALALNDLGIQYMLTYTMNYFNLSLYTESWDLAIIDQPYWQVWNLYLDDIENYFDGGGQLLMSGFTINNNPSHTLWAKLGFSFASNLADPDPIYIWASGHDIFNQPIAYGASNFTSPTDFGTTGDLLTVESNGIALAGHTASPTAGEAIIIARDDTRALYNGYLIDMLDQDTDDSTYEDRLELWINEITFMLRPRCTFNVIVPAEATLGDTFPVEVEIINDGLGAAIEGSITITVPGSLGTLVGPATLPFNIPSGGSDSVVWNIEVTGIGSHTLSFSADYHGFPGTTYSHGPFSGTLDTVEPTTPPTTPPPTLPPGIPGFPIEAIAIGAIIAIGAGIVYRRRKR